MEISIAGLKVGITVSDENVQLNPEFFEELSSVEDLLVVKGGNVPPPQKSDYSP